MSLISSLSNPRVMHARKLHRRSVREEHRQFLIEGCRAVATALGEPGRVEEVFLDPDANCADEIRSLAATGGSRVIEVTDRVLNAVADTRTPQGVVAVARRPDVGLDDIADPTLVLVLVAIADPGNAGTLVRSAAAAACDAVVFTAGSVDPFSPKTVRAAAGLVSQMPVVMAGELEEVAGDLRGRGMKLIGASAGAEKPLDGVDLTEPTAVVLGNEAWGLPPEAESLLDAVVTIPMPGSAESLNVAVAGSILLFEAVRQRGTTG